MQRRGIFKLLGNLKNAWDQGTRRSIRTNTFVYGEDVVTARNNGLPIVALESTIITHGMPYPNNLDTALSVEDIVRKKGAVPATIGILNGQVHIGLTHEQLEVLSKADLSTTIKCSRRDLALIMSQKFNGGTTVSATMLLAHLADIPIMATGGIGGVHRGAELSFDVSTDLIELGQTRVAVVCSGVKSILDIPKTLEYLETQGVPVIKIGETDEFPAFYCAGTHDKIRAPYRISSAKAAASIIKAQTELGLKSGILFAVPIPSEFALDPNEMEDAISEALERARSKSITGKAVTPFLLEELNKLTTGLSLQSNIALIENNAAVAAEIAVDLAQENTSVPRAKRSECILSANGNPVVIGGAIMDTTLQVTDAEFTADGRTHAGRSHESCGGVGRNVASALISLGLNGTRLISVVGNDQPGKAIIKSLGNGAQTVEQLSHTNTARCSVIVDKKGECHLVIGEMEAFTAISPQLIDKHRKEVESASIIVLDGNLPLDTMRFVLELASDYKIPVWYEPTDINTATKLFQSGDGWRDVLHFMSPNKNELTIIANYFGIPIPVAKPTSTPEITTIAEQLLDIVPVIISTLGSQGVLVSRRGVANQPFYDTEGRLIRDQPVASRLYPPTTRISANSNGTFNVSGCGDCLTAGILYGIHKNFNETNCISVALRAASLSLKSFDAVPDTLSALRHANT